MTKLKALAPNPKRYDWVARNLEAGVKEGLSELVKPHSAVVSLSLGFGGDLRQALVVGRTPEETCEMCSYYVLAALLASAGDSAPAVAKAVIARLGVKAARDKLTMPLPFAAKEPWPQKPKSPWPKLGDPQAMKLWLEGLLEELPGTEEFEFNGMETLESCWREMAEEELDRLEDDAEAAKAKRVRALLRRRKVACDAALQELREAGVLQEMLEFKLGDNAAAVLPPTDDKPLKSPSTKRGGRS